MWVWRRQEVTAGMVDVRVSGNNDAVSVVCNGESVKIDRAIPGSSRMRSARCSTTEPRLCPSRRKVQ